MREVGGSNPPRATKSAKALGGLFVRIVHPYLRQQILKTKQNKKMDKYTVFVVYSLKGNNYTEKVNLKSTHKFFNTPEEAIEAIKNEIEQEYHNKDYSDFDIKLPEVKRDERTGNCWVYAGYFRCAYTFGPLVYYDIYINSIHNV